MTEWEIKMNLESFNPPDSLIFPSNYRNRKEGINNEKLEAEWYQI